MWQLVAESESSLLSSNCNHQEVLEGLQPPESVMSLTIKCYMGKIFPKWMCMKVSSNGGSQSPLNQLAKLKLCSCEMCEIMPTLGHLHSLKILEIEGMGNVRRIGSEFYGESKGNVKLFPVLERLKLYDMRSLEEWEAPDEERTVAFPSLQELVIDECSVLKSIPSSHLFSLKSMKIESCPKLISLPIGSTSLEYLDIAYCHELESISRSQDLVSLKRMKISTCGNLTSLPIGSTPLEYLDIAYCSKLESISRSQDLVSLKHMKISNCSKLTSLPIGLTSLEYLDIAFCPELESISSSKDLVSLKHMKISNCSKLTSLPIGSTSLEDRCEELESISSLQDLASLKIVEIVSCPELTLSSKGLNSLNRLEIKYISNLSADAFCGLSSLEHLFIQSIENLELMPSVEDLTSLKSLKIWWCQNLTSLPVGLHLLNRLENLVIWRCHKITALSPEIKSCTSLKQLSVWDCRGLISIETDLISSLTQLEALFLGHFSDELVEFPGFDETRPVNNPSLKKLFLGGMGSINSLPYLGHLTTLKELTITDCGSLISLPPSMQQLSKLTSLCIRGCRLLKEKFKEDRSDFWPNISHIAHIIMDGEVIQDLRS